MKKKNEIEQVKELVNDMVSPVIFMDCMVQFDNNNNLEIAYSKDNSLYGKYYSMLTPIDYIREMDKKSIEKYKFELDKVWNTRVKFVFEKLFTNFIIDMKNSFPNETIFDDYVDVDTFISESVRIISYNNNIDNFYNRSGFSSLFNGSYSYSNDAIALININADSAIMKIYTMFYSLFINKYSIMNGNIDFQVRNNELINFKFSMLRDVIVDAILYLEIEREYILRPVSDIDTGSDFYDWDGLAKRKHDENKDKYKVSEDVDIL